MQQELGTDLSHYSCLSARGGEWRLAAVAIAIVEWALGRIVDAVSFAQVALACMEGQPFGTHAKHEHNTKRESVLDESMRVPKFKE